MADVFVSYTRDQRERVKAIPDLLQEEGLSVWFDARLEPGRGEGFDAEIEREVTSAHCVIVCWTSAALRSVYVRAEAKKGLDREVLTPVFLEQCILPVPFNAIDTIDLSRWYGDKDDPNWQRTLTQVRKTVEEGKRDGPARMAHARATYDRINEQIYPGTLAALSRRIVALDEMDAAHYLEDIEALLEWLRSIADKQLRFYEQHERELGATRSDDALRLLENPAGRANQIARIRELLSYVDSLCAQSQQLLAPGLFEALDHLADLQRGRRWPRNAPDPERPVTHAPETRPTGERKRR